MKQLIVFMFLILLLGSCSKVDKQIIVSFEIEEQDKHQWYDSIISGQDTVLNEGYGRIQYTILTKTNLGQTLSTNTVGVQQPLSDSLSSDVEITDESDTLIYESGKDLNFVVAATDYFLTDPDISKLKIKVSTNGIYRTHRNLELGTSHFRVR
jgi:hypothetical protein